MTRSLMIWLIFAAWLCAMLVSFYALNADPVGDGFTRGSNRLTGFLAWQFGAAILAFVAFIASRGLAKGSIQRWLARVPLWWSGALLIVFIGTVIYLFVAPPQ